ncbi:MAG: hydrolase [Arcobacter sp.]|nr:MAG: hydrolase [Arcobacter sp.]
MKRTLFLLICASFLFISCASTQKKQISAPKKLYTKLKYQNTNISTALLHYFNTHRDISYKLGGNTNKVQDCSSFVQKAFKQSLNISLPRTTYYQAKRGFFINKKDLQTGDLVFFKPSKKYRHVGIYLKNKKFMHISSSKGVIISSLNNVFWAKYYWKSKRVIPINTK